MGDGSDLENVPGAAGALGPVVSPLELATSGGMQLVDLIQSAEALNAIGRREEAARLYKAWIAHTESPLSHIACFNLGATLSASGDYSGAKEWYEAALKGNPGFLQAYLNLGSAFEQLGDHEGALAQWKLALASEEADKPESNPLMVHALNNLGRLLETRKEYDEALLMLERSLSLDNSQKDVYLHLIHLRQRQCLWPVYKTLPGVSKELLKKWTSPLAMLAESDDPKAQLNAAKTFVEHKYSELRQKLAPPGGYGHKKIRLGYLSSDYSLHPVSMLMVEMFELHDRSKFEVHGFCWSPEDGSTLRQRVIGAFDKFSVIKGMTDEQAARAIRESEIDILVDLQGLTSGARPYILAHRPAPVQVTYLGFPGATGLPWIDYVIADDYVIPEKYERFFTEKPLRMPDCFQVSDSKRPVGPTPTRAENGLPEDAFVYCAFNNNYKYTKDHFGAWMRILKRVEKSVLWLLADNKWARDNMVAEAKRLGVDPDRLIFATRVSPQDYLARYRIADLFLDTFPFNGGTTANDALFMGLPIVTLSGRTFASRMAGSLLRSVGLSELITTNLADYEKLAVRVGSDRGYHADVKARLALNLKTSRAFDIPAQVGEVEKLYESVFVAGEAPTGISAGSGKSEAGGLPVAVATLQTGRGTRIIEWLAFHMVAGVEKFYVYTADPGDGLAPLLLKLSQRYPITVHNVPARSDSEKTCFSHAYSSYSKDVSWMAFLGPEDFLCTVDDSQLAATLEELGEGYSAVAVYRRLFGSAGHIGEPMGTLIESFARCASIEHPGNLSVRSVVRGGLEGVGFPGGHVFSTSGQTVDENGRPMKAGATEGASPSFARIAIARYATQSYTRFMERGAAMGRDEATLLAEFVSLDRNECGDSHIPNMLVRTKLKMREIEACLKG